MRVGHRFVSALQSEPASLFTGRLSPWCLCGDDLNVMGGRIQIYEKQWPVIIVASANMFDQIKSAVANFDVRNEILYKLNALSVQMVSCL